jgi:hypothetical protein
MKQFHIPVRLRRNALGLNCLFHIAENRKHEVMKPPPNAVMIPEEALKYLNFDSSNFRFDNSADKTAIV